MEQGSKVLDGPTLKVGDKKTINGWAMYDWSNSVYSLVITSTIFPIYYNAVTSSDATDKVQFFGFEWVNTALYAAAISWSFLIIALASPFLSSMADYSGKKKSFMRFFCYMGGLSCASLFFFTGDNIYLGIFGFMLAAIGFSGSLVFYNAFLPEIASIEDQDRVSAKGFAYGYVGSVILQVICLILIQQFELFGYPDEGIAVRSTFLITGIWWIGFAQITFARLPDNVFKRKIKGEIITKGYAELKLVVSQLKDLPRLKRFLLSFFFYSAGVQTVMYLAASFGSKELELPDDILIMTILVIQLVAIAGAYLFSMASGKYGNINALSVAVLIWVGVCIGVYFVTDATGFMIAAAVVGFVMGGIQSLSRSTYSKMLPETEDHASFFSFYDVTEKIAIVLGTGAFGFIETATGGMRNSVFVLMLFFVVGLIILRTVRGRSVS
jgi:UMF1 family MFS transporter